MILINLISFYSNQRIIRIRNCHYKKRAILTKNLTIIILRQKLNTVKTNGRCFNARLVYEGYAHAYLRFPFQFMEEFQALEQEARGKRRGLWAR